MRRWPCVALAVAALVAAVGMDAVRLSFAARSLDSAAGDLRLAEGAIADPHSWNAASIDRAAAVVAADRERIRSDRSTIAGDPLVAGLAAAPRAGAPAAAVRDLADAMLAADLALSDGLAAARMIAAADAEGDGSRSGRALAALAAAAPRFDALRAQVEPVLGRLRLDQMRGGLPGPLRRAVSTAVDALARADAQATTALVAGRELAPALGVGGTPRTYLLLFANPSELRPTGGYYGAVGSVTFAAGEVTDLAVVNQYDLNGRYGERFPPPAELAAHLRFVGGSLEIGDAGWDPDFPTAAGVAERLFASATGRQVDGAVSLDPAALSAVLRFTGPVDVPGYGTFDASTAFDRLNYLVNVASDNDKTPIAALAKAIVTRLAEEPATGAMALVDGLVAAARAKHILISVRDPVLASAVHRAGLDGSLAAPPPDGDSLLVVDANVGGTKSDAYVDRRLTLDATVAADGLVAHRLDIDYAVAAPATATEQRLNTGDYQDYLRVYLPETASNPTASVIADGAAHPAQVESNVVDRGHRVLGIFLTVARGHAARVEVDYTVPVRPHAPYQLLVQKQPGTGQLPLLLRVVTPAATRTVATALAGDREFTYR